MFIYVLEREKGERERAKHWLGASYIHPKWGWNPQPSICPKQELNPQPIGVWDHAPTNWDTLARAGMSFLSR